MREVKKVVISLYRKTEADDFPKIVKDLKLSPMPDNILKAKATRLLNNHAKDKMSPWKRSQEYHPEYYRDAGVYQVRIHKFE